MRSVAGCLALFCSGVFGQQVITTIAGSNFAFPATPIAAVNAPLGSGLLGTLGNIFADLSGNLYFADGGNSRVFKIDPAGSLTVVAGNGLFGYSGDGGPATSAALNAPFGIAVDPAGNLFFADTNNCVVRKVSTAGIITTVAGNGVCNAYYGDGGPATTAALSAFGLALDNAGYLYIADSLNNRIRRVSPSGIITTFAGTGKAGYSGDGGPATSATLFDPEGLIFDSAGEALILDGNNVIRKITRDGLIHTVVGLRAELDFAHGLAYDNLGNLYVADTFRNRIRRISANGRIATIAGSGKSGYTGDGGHAIDAGLYQPLGVAADPAGNLYVTDTNGYVRKIASDGTITTFAGDGRFQFGGDGGPGPSANVNFPEGLAVDAAGNSYIADTDGNRVRKITPDGAISTIAGTGAAGYLGDGGLATSAQLNLPVAVAVDTSGNVYIAEYFNNVVRKVTPQGIISTIAGIGINGHSGDGGPANRAALSAPDGLTFDNAGNLYISEVAAIRMVSTTGTISTVAGNNTFGYSGDGGLATNAQLGGPAGLSFDAAGNLFIMDASNLVVRKVSTAGIITTVAGTYNKAGYSGDGGPALSARFYFPDGIAIDSAQNLYIADGGNNAVRRISPSGIITGYVGNGKCGSSGDGGPVSAALLCGPNGVAFDAAGSLYIADSSNNRVRKVLSQPPGVSVSPASVSFSGSAGGAAPAAQFLTVSSSIPYVGFSIQVSTADGANWLSADVATGVTPRSIQITANPVSLSPGSYSGTITLASVDALPATITISASFAVGAGQPPSLAIDQTNLIFTFPAQSIAATQTVRVRNAGGGTLNFSAVVASGSPWLTVTPVSGSATPAQPAALSVTASPSGLAAGTYKSSITIGTLTVPVTATISTNPSALLLSQAGLSYTAVAQGGVVPPQSFSVVNLGTGALNLRTDTSTVTGGNWLSSSTAATSGISVNVDTSKLAAGRYYGLVNVRSTGAANSPQVATISLEVLPAGTDVGAVLAPNELSFHAVAGAESPGSQAILVYDLAGTPKTFAASASGSFIQLAPTAATVLPDQPVPLLIQPFTSTLAAGTYQNQITLQFSDGRVRTVGVTLIVDPRPASAASRTTAPACVPSKLLPAITSLGGGFSVPAGWPIALQTQVQDDCGTPLTSGSVIAEFSNGDPPLSLMSLQDGHWDGTWQTRVSAAGVNVTIRALSRDMTLSGTKQVAGGFEQNQQPPIIASGGITDAASSRAFPPLAPGSLIDVFGSLLSDQTAEAPSVPWGTSLGDTSLLIAGTSLPIASTSASQVTAVIPYGITVNTQQQILVQRADTLSLPVPVSVAAASPAIFTNGGTQGLIADTQGNPITTTNPAKAGDVVTIYCTGLGELQQPVNAGTSGPAASVTSVPVTVTIGGLAAPVQFSGLAPQQVAVYAVKAVIPAGLASGTAAPVVITSQTAPPAASPAVTIAIQ